MHNFLLMNVLTENHVFTHCYIFTLRHPKDDRRLYFYFVCQSTPWPGGYLPSQVGGYLHSQVWMGITYLPRWRVPTLAGGYLPWPGGYLPWMWGTYLGWGGVPTLDGGRGTYLRWGRGTYLGWVGEGYLP